MESLDLHGVVQTIVFMAVEPSYCQDSTKEDLEAIGSQLF